jgi:hypothetical protein
MLSKVKATKNSLQPIWIISLSLSLEKGVESSFHPPPPVILPQQHILRPDLLLLFHFSARNSKMNVELEKACMKGYSEKKSFIPNS